MPLRTLALSRYNKTMPLIEDKLPISIDFNRKHEAKLVNFNGWLMPTFFKSILEEYRATRTTLGLFDVSHMGRQRISGPESKIFLSKIICNNVINLKTSKALYSPMLNINGGIIDDLIIYKESESDYLVVNNAGNHNIVCDWYREQSHGFQVSIEDVTTNLGQIAVQGPKAEATLRLITGFDGHLDYFSHQKIIYQGQALMVSATGYTGEKGWELYASAGVLMDIWQRLIDEHAAQACGLGARDILRLEAGYCLHGNDIDIHSTPSEAALEWTLKNTGDYIGKSKAFSRNKRLVGLAFSRGQKILARHDLEVYDLDDQPIGRITSANYSPILERGIALAYLSEAYYKEHRCGSKLKVKIRDKEHIATLAEPWFYRNIKNKLIQDIA